MKRKITMMLLCCGMLLFAGCGKQKAVEEQPQTGQTQDVPQAILPALTEEETGDVDVYFAPALSLIHI